MMKHEYKTICYYSQEDQAYVMFAPDLPGCFADGETAEEAKENIREVIEEWVSYAQELGREVPGALTALESTGPSVLDVASYVLSRTGPVSTMMLQKLLYYCKAWSLAWFHAPLFQTGFEAWQRGPVSRELFSQHRGRRVIAQEDIASSHVLSASERKLIDNVLSVYQEEDPEWLSSLTHEELPWRQTRGDLPEDARCDRQIDPALMEDYYSSLVL